MDDRPANGELVYPARPVAPHTGPCDHGSCAVEDFVAVADGEHRCCAGHHPEAVRHQPTATVPVPPHTGPCRHDGCEPVDLLAAPPGDDGRCCVGHHPEVYWRRFTASQEP